MPRSRERAMHLRGLGALKQHAPGRLALCPRGPNNARCGHPTHPSKTSCSSPWSAPCCGLGASVPRSTTVRSSAHERALGWKGPAWSLAAAASSVCTHKNSICRNTRLHAGLRARTRSARRTRTGASAAVSAGACGSGGSAPGLASLMRSLYTFTRVSPPQRAATSAVLYCAHAPYSVGYGSCQCAGYGSCQLPARCASLSRQTAGGFHGAAVCSTHWSRAQEYTQGPRTGVTASGICSQRSTDAADTDTLAISLRCPRQCCWQGPQVVCCVSSKGHRSFAFMQACGGCGVRRRRPHANIRARPPRSTPHRRRISSGKGAARLRERAPARRARRAPAPR